MNYLLLILGALALVLALSRSADAKKHRRRNSTVEMITFILYLIAGALLLGALVTWNAPATIQDPPTNTTQSTAQSTSAPTADTTLPVDTTVPPTTTEPEPVLQPGWNDIGGKRYYGKADGTMHIGWLELDGESYYFKEDGSMAKGEVKIDGKNYHFTSTGKRIIMVNPWNPVPEDYVLDLVSLSSGYATEGNKVHTDCEAALKEMINACNSSCPGVCVVSGYRSIEAQTRNFNRRVQSFIDKGYSEEEARAKTAEIIAVPGTSEHHLGLAADIVDTRLWALEEQQEDLPAQQWLMKNCWKYGFILRYPKDKIDVTGIIYEPWHYRYVGKELAQEIHEAGDITLEEYIQRLTEE
jgi:D-alanyl-D-alanine carboxypeptidase